VGLPRCASEDPGDRNSRLAHHEDEDISQGLEEMCRDEGINVLTDAIVNLVEGKSGEWIRLLGTRDGAELSLEGTHLLVAGGRTPNTSVSASTRREWRRPGGAM
jgi:pyruvate/2-oxoglutarate dehydrogenase complex dihydrolipoamide dehydrogenase (E3) component